MIEKDITTKILKYLRSLDNCYCFKEHGGRYGTSGVPDIICCYRSKFIAFEVKTDNGKTSKLQEIAIRDIKKASGVAVVVRGVDEVKNVINNMCEKIKLSGDDYI